MLQPDDDGFKVLDDAELFARTSPRAIMNWGAIGGALLAIGISGAFWWFFIWAGTRLWKP